MNPFGYCPCYGRGVIRDKQTQRYKRCPCGRFPGSWGARKLAEQEKKDKRLREIKAKGWE